MPESRRLAESLLAPQVLSHHLFIFIRPSDAPFTCEEKFLLDDDGRRACCLSRLGLHAERFPRVSRAREAVAGGSIPPRCPLLPLCSWFRLLPLSKSVSIIIFPPLFLRLATHEASSAPPSICCCSTVRTFQTRHVDRQAENTQASARTYYRKSSSAKDNTCPKNPTSARWAARAPLTRPSCPPRSPTRKRHQQRLDNAVRPLQRRRLPHQLPQGDRQWSNPD